MPPNWKKPFSRQTSGEVDATESSASGTGDALPKADEFSKTAPWGEHNVVADDETISQAQTAPASDGLMPQGDHELDNLQDAATQGIYLDEHGRLTGDEGSGSTLLPDTEAIQSSMRMNTQFLVPADTVEPDADSVDSSDTIET